LNNNNKTIFLVV